MEIIQQFIAIVPAAGVGKRMQANCPKQYLRIHDKTILSHTVNRLLSHPKIAEVIIALGENDQYFKDTGLAKDTRVIRVNGGKERVDSVLSGLKAVDVKQYPWVLVHDAARPCVTHGDIDELINQCLAHDTGGILAVPVRDTMKRGQTKKCMPEMDADKNGITLETINVIQNTVERDQLWHALTPQLYKTIELTNAIENALSGNITITDEASAIEHANINSLLVVGSSDNIKITHPNDLALAEFYLDKQAKLLNQSLIQ